jgi:hypothetical protein
MNEETVPKPTMRSQVQTRRFRAGAVLVLAVAVGLILWLILRNTGGSSTASFNATAVSVAQLKTLAGSVRHPVFWVGPRKGNTYELTRTSNGTLFVRYLPPGVNIGSKKPYLTIATYPFPGAFPALQKVAQQRASTPISIAHHGLAVASTHSPDSVHAAYPGVNYQVEVYDPSPGAATLIVRQLAAFGSLSSGAATQKATAVSPAGLRSLASELGHPIYWVGPRKGYTYELTRTRSEAVYIRYLLPGVKVGTKKPYLTVGTYLYPNAYGALQALAKGKSMVTFKPAGGELAVLDTKHPKSIHLAYPKSNYQVEVYGPVPSVVRRIVTSGQVSSIG